MRAFVLLIGLLFASVQSSRLCADELAVNGSFESNGGVGSSTFSNWTVITHPQSSASRFHVQSSTRPAIAKFDVPATAFGTFAAMSDQASPGATAIYQDVLVPTVGPTWIQMRLFILNQAPEYIARTSLNPSVDGNQQVRVDIVSPAAADPFDVSGVLLNVFTTAADFPRETGYFPIAINLAPFAGQLIRIRIAEVNNRHGLLVGVDDVRVTNIPVATCAPVRPREGGAACNLDIDGNGLLEANDGLLVLRRMLGFRGASVIANVSFGGCATRTTEVPITNALDQLFAEMSNLDLDGDGSRIATTDGLILLRGLLGLKENAATAGAIAPGASRASWSAIQSAANLACLTAWLP